MAGTRLLQALTAAGRARSATVAMGHRRCPLPRQPLRAHQALLGLGRPRAVRPSSLVPPFSTNAVEGEGITVAGANTNGRFKTANADAATQKTKAYPFDPLGTSTGKAEDVDEVSMGEVCKD